MKMTLAEIQAASAQEYANVKKDAATSSETTPPVITDKIREFAASLGAGEPIYVPVVSDKHGLYGWCSDGVEQKVIADGGTIAYGWTIWEWPGALVTAEFHTVWRDDAGALTDITPKPAGEERILFVEDTSYPQGFNFDHRPRNRRARLYEEADPVKAVAVIKEGLSGGKLRYEEGRANKAGLSLDQWLKGKIPADPLACAIDEVIAACNDFEEHFDSLGTAGSITPDAKLMELIKRRMATQARMKAVLKASKEG